MELRLLQSFVIIAEEGSITRAARILHITQPALSRQLVQLEQGLDCTLFERSKNRMVLTEEGMLLLRRAHEILDLVALTESELADTEEEVEGTISIGSGELLSTVILAHTVASFHQSYPKVSFNMLTGVADSTAEQLDRGLLDFGLFLEPIDKSEYDYLEMPMPEDWVAVVRSDSALAEAEAITPADLVDKSLILPYRPGAQSEIARWFGRGFKGLDNRFNITIGGLGATLVEEGLGVMLCARGLTVNWDRERFSILPLNPRIETTTVLAWKRNVARTAAVNAFIEHVTVAVKGNQFS